MTYDTPFEFLNSDEVAFLTSPNAPDERSVYLDCLALMHDEVIEQSSGFNHSQFRRQERQAFLRDYTMLPNSGIRDKVKTNISIAKQLSLQARSQMISLYLSRTLADLYIDALLEQYRILQSARFP